MSNNKYFFYTSPLQSYRLLNLGIGFESADMYYLQKDDFTYEENIGIPITEILKKNEKIIPCWSIGALIDLLPNSNENLDVTISKNKVCFIHKYYDKKSNMVDGFTVEYNSENLVETLVNAMEYVIKLKI